jgi:hypothetical protein
LAKFREVFSTTAQVVLSLFIIALFIGLGALVLRSGLGSVRYLFAAYILTWVIHAIYVATLVRRFARLRQELNEIGKAK